MRLTSTTTMAHRASKEWRITFEAPHNEASTSRVATKVDKESYIGVIALAMTKLSQLRSTLSYPTSQTHSSNVQQAAERQRLLAP